MEGIRKTFRVLNVLIYALMEGAFAFIIWSILISIFSQYEFMSLALSWYGCAYDTYCILVLLFIVRNAIHRFKWYVGTYPTKARCSNCHYTSKVKRYGEDEYLNAPMTMYIPRGVRFFNIKSDKIPFFEMALRPYLRT